MDSAQAKKDQGLRIVKRIIFCASEIESISGQIGEMVGETQGLNDHGSASLAITAVLHALGEERRLMRGELMKAISGLCEGSDWAEILPNSYTSDATRDHVRIKDMVKQGG